MKWIRLTKEWVDKILLSVPFVNLRYVAYKMRESEELPRSHGWFPIEMNSVEKAICDYAVDVHDKNKLVRDIVYCHQRYLTTPEEYFHFEFDSDNMSHSQRKLFLAEDMMNFLMINTVGIKRCNELEDKYGLYTKLKPYYKREICKVESEEDYDNYMVFLNRHASYFVKPNSSSCGRGCYKVTSTVPSQAQGAINDLEFQQLISNQGSVIEELINQDDSMKQWNPSSVQTIRLNTILTSKGFYVFPAALRIGKENAVVDNAASGGYVAAIDEKTGTVITDAINYRREVYKHNGYILKGWHVPEWDTLLSMAREIQELIPHQRYVGWDFAYSKKGWCVVEANWGEFLTQFVTGKGVRKEFERRIRM